MTIKLRVTRSNDRLQQQTLASFPPAALLTSIPQRPQSRALIMAIKEQQNSQHNNRNINFKCLANVYCLVWVLEGFAIQFQIFWSCCCKMLNGQLFCTFNEALENNLLSSRPSSQPRPLATKDCQPRTHWEAIELPSLRWMPQLVADTPKALLQRTHPRWEHFPRSNIKRRPKDELRINFVKQLINMHFIGDEKLRGRGNI